MTNTKVYLAGLAVVCGIALQPAAASAQTIVDIAVGNEDFESLVAAVTAQDLVETLQGEGPFTVFAPTDDAFAKLPPYVGKILEENPDLLTTILLYHVVPGELFAEDVLANKSLTTVEGSDLRVRSTGNGAFVNFSEITATDIDADNGVIHVIDRVLIPRTVYTEVISSIRSQIEGLKNAARERGMMKRDQAPGYNKNWN